MAIRKAANERPSADKPKISGVQPVAAIAGGELAIRGKGLAAGDKPRVTIGNVVAPIVVGSDSLVIVKVPEGASVGELVVGGGVDEAGAGKVSDAWSCDIGICVAENLHPVTNPAVDAFGNIYTTFSGSRGQKVPVSVYRIDLNFNLRPFINDMMNPTGIAAGPDGMLYISSRFDGIVYQVSPTGNMSVFVEGMGVATGVCFDPAGNLYVGDRSGTVFKVSSTRQIFVYATIEPSISSYHLAWAPDQHLYVSGPTTSSFDSIFRIADNGDVETFYRGLGRPQGMAFDAEGDLYSAASYMGRKGVVRISPNGSVEHFLSGPGIVGLAFSPSRSLLVATTNAVHRVDVGIRGIPGVLISMNAEIIAVGSEMLTAGRLDTNSLFVTDHLNSLGIEVTAKHVVGDDCARLATTVRRALADADLVILSGGLGPTEDDLTRDAVAQAVGCSMSPNDGILSAIERRFRLMNRQMPEINKRQAMILDGAEILPNDRGTAPGQWRLVNGAGAAKVVVLLPGPPSELKSMFTRECMPRLAKIAPPTAIHTAVLRVTGISESQLDQTIAPIYLGRENLVTTVLAHDGDLQVLFRAQCATPEAAAALSEETAAQAAAALGEHVYTRDGQPLEAVIGKRLLEARQTLVVAESATGGGLAERITGIPGSSAYFLGGYVTYSKRMKTELLGVPADLLAAFGAVSKEVAQAMAEGARKAAQSDWAISVTGNAGPSTDGDEAPVGTVYIGVAGSDGTQVTHRMWPVNDRGRVRAFAAQAALDLLNRRLILK